MAVLAIAFQLLGVDPFSGSAGDFAVVVAFTVVVSCALSAATYVLIEAPGRDLIRSLAATRGPAGSAGS